MKLLQIANYGATKRMAISFGFSLVVATSILAATIRVGATFKGEDKYLLLGATEELSATVIVWATFFF